MKKSSILMLTVFFTLVLSIFIFPSAVYAQTGTLGNEKPQISASYTDGDGNLADGNQLTAGSYTMQIALTGMENISQMELTATYGEEVSFGNYSTLADSNSNVDAVCSISGGNLVLGLVSKNADCTAIDSEKTVIFTASITVTSETAVDMENVISVSQNPNFTYLEADYGDVKITGVYDCYALGTNADYAGTVYPMACDLSPQLVQTYTVSGYIAALDSKTATEGKYAVVGAEVKVGDITAVTDNDGKFVLEGLANGTYEAQVTYKYGFTRTFKIVVNGADINSNVKVGIVSCDFNGDGFITTNDYNMYMDNVGKTSTSSGFDIGYDLNRDNFVTTNDYNIYTEFIGVTSTTMVYKEIVLTN